MLFFKIYNFLIKKGRYIVWRKDFDKMGTKWSKVDKVWLIFSILLIIFASIYKFLFVINENSNIILEIMSCVVAVCGVIYVLGIAKQTRYAYFFGISNVILYSIVCYSKGLYISSLYNMFYSFPVMVYGYINWRSVKDNFKVKILSNGKRIALAIGMFFAVCAFAVVSKNILNGSNVLLDAIVSVSACVATFLMAKRYIEQWHLFIVANFFGVIMFLIINLGNMMDVELLMMWSIYLVNSIYGMIEWKKTLDK